MAGATVPAPALAPAGTTGAAGAGSARGAMTDAPRRTGGGGIAARSVLRLGVSGKRDNATIRAGTMIAGSRADSAARSAASSIGASVSR